MRLSDAGRFPLVAGTALLWAIARSSRALPARGAGRAEQRRGGRATHLLHDAVSIWGRGSSASPTLAQVECAASGALAKQPGDQLRDSLLDQHSKQIAVVTESA